MHTPSISIIIPVFRAENYLARCLESIAAQTMQDFELICVNDCSPDGSAAILESFHARMPSKMRVLVNERNMGGGASRERALACARGIYTTFIDSDDYIADDFLETYLDEAKRTGVDIVIGGYTKDTDGKLVSHKPPRGPWSLATYAISCAKLYRTSFLLDKSIRYSDIRCGEDIYFGLSLLYHQATYTVIPYVGYHYYYNSASTTSSMAADQHMERNVATIFEQFRQHHDLHMTTQEVFRIIEYTYVANMINALIVYGRGCGTASMRERVAFFHHDLRTQFPSYRENRLFNPFHPHGQSMKIRMSVGLFMLLERLGIDRLVYELVALM